MLTLQGRAGTCPRGCSPSKCSSSFMGHSSNVSIHRVVGGLRFLSFFLRGDHSRAEPWIVLRVNDSEERWIVRVPEGVSAGVERDSLGPRWFGCDALNNCARLTNTRLMAGNYPTRFGSSASSQPELA